MQGTGGSRERQERKGRESGFSVRSTPSNPVPFANAELLLNETPSKIVNSSLSFRIRAMDSHQPFKLFPA